jgi:hypothetical protein
MYKQVRISHLSLYGTVLTAVMSRVLLLYKEVKEVGNSLAFQLKCRKKLQFVILYVPHKAHVLKA